MTNIIPSSLHKLAKALHQDLLLDHHTLGEIADYCLGFLSKSEKEELHNFLSSLLGGAAGSAEIKAVWNALSTEVTIDDAAGIRALFDCIRSRIADQSMRGVKP